MGTRMKELQDLNRLRQFVVCTAVPARAQWLAASLSSYGVTTQMAGDAESVAQTLKSARPHLVFIDFASYQDESTTVTPSELAKAAGIARAFKHDAPRLPLIAIGSSAQPGGPLAALRAGVRDFVELSAPEPEIHEIVERLIAENESAQNFEAMPSVGRQGRLIVLLGSRAGVGTSTLAAHLSAIMRGPVAEADRRTNGSTAASGTNGVSGANEGGRSQQASEVLAGDEASVASQANRQRVALLDLGLPVGDGLLYMNTAGTFHFAEAVRNLSRFDETLIRTALTPSTYDVPVLSLPRDLSEMRMITHADSLALLNQLRRYFDVLIADLGGFSSPEFVSNMIKAANQTWLVCDQSVGSVVSIAELMQDFEHRKVPRESLQLVVNRYDERYGMSAAQIAERFELPLAGTIPERSLSLLRHANMGELLVKVKAAENDPYLRAVRALAATLADAGQAGSRTRLPFIGKWFGGR